MSPVRSRLPAPLCSSTTCARGTCAPCVIPFHIVWNFAERAFDRLARHARLLGRMRHLRAIGIPLDQIERAPPAALLERPQVHAPFDLARCPFAPQVPELDVGKSGVGRRLGESLRDVVGNVTASLTVKRPGLFDSATALSINGQTAAGISTSRRSPSFVRLAPSRSRGPSPLETISLLRTAEPSVIRGPLASDSHAAARYHFGSVAVMAARISLVTRYGANSSGRAALEEREQRRLLTAVPEAEEPS